MADEKVKRLLAARLPLIMAAVDLGEVICTAMTKADGEHDAQLTVALARVEAALTEVNQAWLGVPMHYARAPLGGGVDDEQVTA